MKILLEHNRSISSNNKENHIDTDLFTKQKMLPNESLSDNFSLYEQYNRERDACELFRLIFVLNPVCSNVLFNMKTEININEGKLSATCISLIDNGNAINKRVYAPNAVNTTDIDYIQAIRDTEYSHEDNGNFTYNCGVDIFNNHIIRSTNFVHVNKIGDFENAQIHKSVYNTIGDYIRDVKGNPIRNNYSVKFDSDIEDDSHLYNTDSLLDMKTAFNEKCREKDGWWGFTNKSYININTSSSDTITANKVLNNRKSCEFVDLYPDRTLFSFIPKYNEHQARAEKNWDYCITYPYENDYDKINEVCGGEKQAIRCDIKRVVNTSSIEIIQCMSMFKHNLKGGDNINVYYYTGDKTSKVFNCYITTVKVVSVGDNNGNFTDRIFNIRYQDVRTIYEYFEFGFFYKKVVANTECDYYFRKFKKIKNSQNKDLRSDVNKVAFSKNIYGDDISQIVFTDDVDINSRFDNNGRPISKVYLTIVKRHKGNDVWYDNVNPRFSGTDIEYSHCFGKVTSGLDFSGIGEESEPFDYNVHRLHNLDKESALGSSDVARITRTFDAWGDAVLQMPKTIEDDITIDFDEFYGDVAEMDYYNYKETIISQVCHRFNTMQREIFNTYYGNLYKDVIIYDDYDVRTRDERGSFTYDTFFINDIMSSRQSIHDAGTATLIYGNIMPEGYFYNPFIEIKLREEDEQIKRSNAKYINYDWCSIEGRVVYLEYEIVNGERVLVKKIYVTPENANSGTSGTTGNRSGSNQPDAPVAHVFEMSTDGYILKIKPPVNYGFVKGDYIALYDKNENKIIWGEITGFENNILSIYFSDGAFGDLSIDILSHLDYFSPENLNRRYFVFWTNESVPLYAKFSLNTRKFCWRMLKTPSSLSTDYDLYGIPFTNGRFYIQKNANFFLKRQDPDGKYGLSIPLHLITNPTNNPITNFVVDGGGRLDLSQFDEIIEKTITCY